MLPKISFVNVLTFRGRAVSRKSQLPTPARKIHTIGLPLSLCLAAFGTAFAQTPNMDAGLSDIIRSYKAGPARPAIPALISYDTLVRRDAQGRVLV